MASAKGLFGAVVGRFVFREAETLEVRDVAEGFRLVSFGGTRDGGWEPGDKIQVYLGMAGMRTYTPITWEGGRSSLLLYVHGSASPGALWAKKLATGDRWQFFGPRRSVRAPGGRIVLFGDETSFAVAGALARVADVKAVFEVTSLDASKAALQEIGVSGTTIQRRPGHIAEIAERLTADLGDATLILTGSAQSIQALRSRPHLRRGKVKAYWSAGKAGLD
jgi:NADPH-dependent ferric siderophore reductase